VIPFAVVVRDVLGHGAAEVPIPDRNQPVQAFFFDRPHEPFRVRVRIGRALRDPDDADSCVPQSAPHVTAPLPIPIADQDVRRGHRTVLGHGQRQEIVQKQDGQVVSSSTRTISRDGKTLTERFTNTQGQNVTDVLVFEKQ